jgi:hypothetical protein
MPRSALFCGATEPTERERATDHRFFAQRPACRARQIAIELNQSTAAVT